MCYRSENRVYFCISIQGTATMKTSIVTNIQQFFRNLILNAVGTKRTLLQYIEDGDISHALMLMDSNEQDVDNALCEYYPQKHDIMRRRNRYPKHKEPYITCKLPRARQRYINEVELFFLLGNPIVWQKVEGDDEAFQLFTRYLQDTRFDSKMRQVKRIAGSETECAKYYKLYKGDDGNPMCDVVVLSRSLGYDLRILKDQYGKLIAVAVGYKLRGADGKPVQYWEFLTAEMTHIANKALVGWQVETYPNPTGKINIAYYQQPKAWDGAEPRMAREEEIDSKIGDTNNYFADPIAVATADAIESMVDPNVPARLIRLTGKDSRFDYLQPAQASELRKMEKDDLAESILFDTFTPDFSFEKLSGMGTVTGVAIRNAMILGFLKRANRMEIYSEVIDREKNVIIAVLQFLYPNMANKLGEMKIKFDFAEPFGDDKQGQWDSIMKLYKTGLMSRGSAVKMLGLSDAPEEELKKIDAEKRRQSAKEPAAEPPEDEE